MVVRIAMQNAKQAKVR